MANNEIINYEDLFYDWNRTATEQEKTLYNSILEYEEEYFPEMTLKNDSIISNFIKREILVNEKPLVEHRTMPIELESIINKYYRLYIKDIDCDFEGMVDGKNKTITILPKYTDNKATILHEMIHIYEIDINNEYPILHDILFICLYNDLKNKVTDLDERILKHSNIYNNEDITRQGGKHDILFFLKSLDLDLRCGYKLGTVCGYGREDM